MIQADARTSDSALFNELAAVKVKITRAYLEAKKMSVFEVGLQGNNSLTKTVLLSTRADQPEIRKAIEQARAAVFSRTSRDLLDERINWTKWSGFQPEDLGTQGMINEAYIIVTPGSRSVDIYLINENTVIKVSHPFVYDGDKRRSVAAGAF